MNYGNFSHLDFHAVQLRLRLYNLPKLPRSPCSSVATTQKRHYLVSVSVLEASVSWVGIGATERHGGSSGWRLLTFLPGECGVPSLTVDRRMHLKGSQVWGEKRCTMCFIFVEARSGSWA